MPIKRETSGRQPCKVLKSIAAGVSRSHEDPIPACLGIAILSLSALPAAAEIASVRVAGGEVRGVAAGAVTSFKGIPSPPAHGLFRGVISESGGSLPPRASPIKVGRTRPRSPQPRSRGRSSSKGWRRRTSLPGVRSAPIDCRRRQAPVWGGSGPRSTLHNAKDVFRDTSFAWPTWSWARLQSRRETGRKQGPGSQVYVTTSITVTRRCPTAPRTARK